MQMYASTTPPASATPPSVDQAKANVGVAAASGDPLKMGCATKDLKKAEAFDDYKRGVADKSIPKNISFSTYQAMKDSPNWATFVDGFRDLESRRPVPMDSRPPRPVRP